MVNAFDPMTLWISQQQEIWSDNGHGESCCERSNALASTVCVRAMPSLLRVARYLRFTAISPT